MARLNYNHLRYFWMVAREGNLSRAAQALNISQSALSIQIRKLETQLGHALFERRGRGLLLTEAGQVALDYTDEIFSTAQELISRLRASGDAERQTLRIGALSTLSRNFQRAFLTPLFDDATVGLVIRSGSLGELMMDLEAHRLDVVLVNQLPLRDNSSTWTAHTIDQQPVSLVGDPDRIAGETDIPTLLRTHPLILPSRDSGVRSGFDAYTTRHNISPVIAAEVDDMAMMRILARENLGLAVLPAIVVRDELTSGGLVEAAKLPEIHETFSAITLQRRFPSTLIERLLSPGRSGPEINADRTNDLTASDRRGNSDH